MRCFSAVILVAAMALPGLAREQRGWGFAANFYGSSNADGTVTRAESVAAYNINQHFRAYVGVPFYFVHISSAASPSAEGSMSGLGNVFGGFRVASAGDMLSYASTIEVTAPTGDKDRGFGTGRVTADWTHQVSRRFSSFMPFGSVGLANTVSDTAFFVRPFSSIGLVGHFDGGTTFDVSPGLRLGASAYGVRGAGQQKIVSKVVPRGATTPAGRIASTSGNGHTNSKANGAKRVFENQPETTAESSAVDDHGFSAWVALNPRRELDLHVGYSRSLNYALNNMFFGVGFRVGK
jgi:hypothetical protein